MWYWVYRLIAALLALLGGAAMTVFARAFSSQAHQITLVLGQTALFAVFALASSLLTACAMILISPASRRKPG